MPKNYYNITHWKAAVEILKEHPKTTARELKDLIEVPTKVIAENIKTDYHKLKREENIKNRVAFYRMLEHGRKEKTASA